MFAIALWRRQAMLELPAHAFLALAALPRRGLEERILPPILAVRPSLLRERLFDRLLSGIL